MTISHDENRSQQSVSWVFLFGTVMTFLGFLGGVIFEQVMNPRTSLLIECAELYEEEVHTPDIYYSERDVIVAEEAVKVGVPMEVAVAVSHVENWSGDSTAVSSAGAVGIMQVMPFWPEYRPDWSEECIDRSGPPWSWSIRPSLTERRYNACLGVRVLQLYHRQYGNWNTALRAYNGALRMPRAGDKYVSLVLSRLDFEGGREDG